MVNHWIIVPVVLPALTAVLLLFLPRESVVSRRVVSVASVLALAGISVALWGMAQQGPQAYAVGDWPAPFGIVVVLDRLSALMLLAASAIALAAVLYAIIGWDRRGAHFHTLFHFQLLGINGAFLTGDIFNLFVFFEVLLIASYGLVLHGGGAWRLKSGFQYAAVNLIASTIFLFAVGLLYGITGTLNMADLAVRVAALPAQDHALLRVGALLLFVVFAVKCALVPFHWWLPSAYSAGAAPATALFAVLTKVGAYAIIRMHTLVFAGDAAGISGTLQDLLVPAAAVTLVAGAIGVLGSRSMLQLASYSTVASMGTLLLAAAGLGAEQISAALYYLLHSCLIGAALFLLVDLVAAGRGRVADRLLPEAPVPQALMLGGLFFLCGMAMVGMPPLSGFVGKVAILDGLRGTDDAVLAWAVILGTGVLLLVGFVRAGSTVFWKAGSAVSRSDTARPAARRAGLVVAALVAGTAVLSALGGAVLEATDATAAELLDRELYIRAVAPAASSPES
ncbi:MAG: monovalent cation/H+ antiporter subunit D [Thalassobaculum sp.]|uniref:monovalent cation/H+ antiporter subunit D n=1 Tax=Thalassobaculum sp. TaxID=2022740 RepID=UPI0032EB351C